MPFRSVNRRDAPGFQPEMQRHHLLPRQLFFKPCFAKLIEAVGNDRLGYDDFRRNGLLLPATEDAAFSACLPLHRGPHRAYNELVMERFGQIEARWSRLHRHAPEAALGEALMRLDLLRNALRNKLLNVGTRPYRLNRHDPLGKGLDFAELDAMADALWASSNWTRH
ncbi:AHH domain-containing protein [Aurantiacibacter sp. DGU5]|uniref:AHH domain-containing protein n=1 Tax=Aurantiacibacter flavus TaxID=3145232 RepID=A0ABV0CUL0_9SPHN